MTTLHDKLVKQAAGSESRKRDSMELDTIGLDKLSSALEGLTKVGQEDLDSEVVKALTGALDEVGPARKGKA